MLLMFAEDRDHMSGFLVIMFYLLIFADGLFAFGMISSDEPTVGLIMLGIFSLICAVGLIILLKAYKIGGYIVLFGTVFQVIIGVFTDFSPIIALSVIKVICVLVVLFGSRKYNLIELTW